MNANGRKFRKRPRQAPADQKALSATLRQIGEHIQKRDFPSALSKANQALADPSLSETDQGRVLALVGDSEFKRGRFAEASPIHLQAAARGLSHPESWLRPLVGCVRDMLKVPRVDQALLMARHAVEMAESKMAAFDEQVRLANQTVAAGGTVNALPVPPRVSVVATRMGHLFLQEGEPELAEEFFSRAIETNPGGACRALQGLARTALARRDFARALELSTRAIRWGKFRAKTLPAWPVLVAARRQMGGWRISDRLVRGLSAAPAGLRARTVLAMARELRKHDMRQWQEIAEEWSAREGHQFPIIEAEIRKMLLATAKTRSGNGPARKEHAEKLLRTPGLSPGEWLAAAKESVQASLLAGESVNFGQLLAVADAKHGPEFVLRVRHGLALSCQKAQRLDLAGPLLRQNIQAATPAQEIWGKSIWALARREGGQGRHADAAALFQQSFEAGAVPIRFRLQAQLLWAQALVAAGQPEVLLQARPLITSALHGVQDFEVRMDFSRQLAAASPEFKDWGAELFDQAAAMALRQFQDAIHPSVAMDILFKMTRRQVCDFARHADALRQWESLDEDKRAWLWTSRACFWEYLGLLVKAYGMERRGAELESFARSWLDDPATPPEGRVQVGIPYGRHLLNSQRYPEAFALFDRLLAESPAHPLCVTAWYWKALVAHKKGDVPERNRCISCLRLAAGSKDATLHERQVIARAGILLADLDVGRVDATMADCSPQGYETLRLHVLADLRYMP